MHEFFCLLLVLIDISTNFLLLFLFLQLFSDLQPNKQIKEVSLGVPWWPSVLRIWHCLAVVMVTAVARVWSLAQEFLRAVGMTEKSQDVTHLEKNMQAKAETQHPDLPGWEGLQPPLCYIRSLHVLGHDKDATVIAEWLWICSSHRPGWVGLSYPLGSLPEVTHWRRSFRCCHGRNSSTQVDSANHTGTPSVPAGVLYAESGRPHVHFVF